MLSLIKYNLNYYIKSTKYLPPVLVFVAFWAINYQTSPIGVWSNLHITSIAVFMFSSWLAVSLVNCEDRMQQNITILHTKNEPMFHISKIVAIHVALVPFYVITLGLPLVLGSFPRRLQIREIFIYFLVYILMGIMGVAVGILFNSDIIKGEIAILMHIVTVAYIGLPFNVVFSESRVIGFLYYIAPPVNFLAERWHELGDYNFALWGGFILFILWVMVYGAGLMWLYLYWIMRKNKE